MAEELKDAEVGSFVDAIEENDVDRGGKVGFLSISTDALVFVDVSVPIASALDIPCVAEPASLRGEKLVKLVFANEEGAVEGLMDDVLHGEVLLEAEA